MSHGKHLLPPCLPFQYVLKPKTNSLGSLSGDWLHPFANPQRQKLQIACLIQTRILVLPPTDANYKSCLSLIFVLTLALSLEVQIL